MVNKEWFQRKEWEYKVGNWVSKFEKASGNNAEWQKVFRGYLQSDVWKEKRELALNRADGKCENCGAIFINSSSLDVHHLNYERIGGNERLEDMKVLCFPCHRNADRKRERLSEIRKKNEQYEKRVHGFAAKRYGECWQYEKDESDIEIEFILYLYKKWHRENQLEFKQIIDPELDLGFLEFWDLVIKGDY